MREILGHYPRLSNLPVADFSPAFDSEATLVEATMATATVDRFCSACERTLRCRKYLR